MIGALVVRCMTYLNLISKLCKVLLELYDLFPKFMQIESGVMPEQART